MEKWYDLRQVAELGYFIIKVIERYQLDETVGLDKLNEHFENKPQIWFIPDNESDYPASKNILLELEEKINERIKKLENEQFFWYKLFIYSHNQLKQRLVLTRNL